MHDRRGMAYRQIAVCGSDDIPALPRRRPEAKHCALLSGGDAAECRIHPHGEHRLIRMHGTYHGSYRILPQQTAF